MALELKRGLATTKACFFDEPGELQFIVNLASDLASYELRQFQHYASWGGAQEDYKVILNGECRPKRIIQQISTVLWKIHEEIGPEEYQKRWGRDEFPIAKYKTLMES